ncbi:Uncharacterised protein [Segatella copri]|nr:Uncharacterised protein [Segatella copri]
MFLIKNVMIGLTFSFIFNNPFHRERFLLLFHINLFIFLKKMFLLSLSSLKLCNFAEKF